MRLLSRFGPDLRVLKTDILAHINVGLFEERLFLKRDNSPMHKGTGKCRFMVVHTLVAIQYNMQDV